jgi:hypothetical protein
LNIEMLENIVHQGKNKQSFTTSPAKMIPQRLKQLPNTNTNTNIISQL